MQRNEALQTLIAPEIIQGILTQTQIPASFNIPTTTFEAAKKALLDKLKSLAYNNDIESAKNIHDALIQLAIHLNQVCCIEQADDVTAATAANHIMLFCGQIVIKDKLQTWFQTKLTDPSTNDNLTSHEIKYLEKVHGINCGNPLFAPQSHSFWTTHTIYLPPLSYLCGAVFTMFIAALFIPQAWTDEEKPSLNKLGQEIVFGAGGPIGLLIGLAFLYRTYRQDTSAGTRQLAVVQRAREDRNPQDLAYAVNPTNR